MTTKAKKRTPENIRHAMGSPRWGTSRRVIPIAHNVLGKITVDPFSEDEFNAHVRAERILTGEFGRDGFRDRWLATDDCPRADHVLAGLVPSRYAWRPTDATALVNPPGSDDGQMAKDAWALLDWYHSNGHLDSAIWVAFNLNQMQTLQNVSRRSPLSRGLVTCVPSKRLPFVAHSTSDAQGEAPSHPMFFTLIPSHDTERARRQVADFARLGGELGDVIGDMVV